MSQIKPSRPEDILSDENNFTNYNGLNIRKGTVAAFLNNAIIIDNEEPNTSTYIEAEKLIKDTIPNLKALRIFDVFNIKSEKVKKIIMNTDPELEN